MIISLRAESFMRETKIHALVASISTVIFWGWPFYQLYGHNQVHWLQYETHEYFRDLGWVLVTGLLIFLVLFRLARRVQPRTILRVQLLLLLLASLQFLRFLIRHLIDIEKLSPGAWLAIWATPVLIALGLISAWVAWVWPLPDLRKAVLAFLGCLALVFVINWRPHGFYENHVRRARVTGQAGDPTIHLIVFDGLAYDVLFDRGSVVDDYPVFAALAERSHVFHRAWAPGDTTAISVPAMLTGRLGVELEGSLFCSLADRYNVWITGAYFPYCQMVECYYACDTQTLVLKNIFLRALPKRYTDASLLAIVRGQEEMLVDNLSSAVTGAGNFYFTHFVLPHFPYLLDRDGLRPNFTLGTQSMTAYRQQVAYADALLGRILAKMEELGQLENSLVIVTSDHANRATLGSAQRQHIPFFVRLPGQKTASHHRTPINSIGVKDLVESFIDRDPMFLANLDCPDCAATFADDTGSAEEKPTR